MILLFDLLDTMNFDEWVTLYKCDPNHQTWTVKVFEGYKKCFDDLRNMNRLQNNRVKMIYNNGDEFVINVIVEDQK